MAALTTLFDHNVPDDRKVPTKTLRKMLKVNITGYYGRLRLLTRGQLTGPSLNSLFTKTTTIC